MAQSEREDAFKVTKEFLKLDINQKILNEHKGCNMPINLLFNKDYYKGLTGVENPHNIRLGMEALNELLKMKKPSPIDYVIKNKRMETINIKK